jgi:spermidine synthase
MIPWQHIDTARVPGAKVELRLMRRGTEFSMMLGQNELMNSRLSGSEEALATLACRRIEAVKRPHVLIGGLGMGFTLRAALAVLGAEARIVVAELVPAVIAWARGPMADLFGDSLADPRASIRSADVIEVIGSHPSAFDAILLDVDNGPEGLIREANDALYDIKGLAAIRRSLRPGGVVAVWSSGPSRRRLRCERGRRARHGKAQRCASRHLVRHQVLKAHFGPAFERIFAPLKPLDTAILVGADQRHPRTENLATRTGRTPYNPRAVTKIETKFSG